jgi:hypothetical protein
MVESSTHSRKSTQEAGVVRLDSWKEIAAYLGKSIRTVQRWEELERLPIHRLPHADRSSVFAFSRELDAWRASRSHEFSGNGNDSEANGTASGQATKTNPLTGLDGRLTRPRRWWLAVLTAIVVLAALGSIGFFTRVAPSVQILSCTPLTHDGRWKTGLATDGVWVYFIEQLDNGPYLCKVSIHGGESKYPPAEPEALRLLAPQRGLIATDQNQNPRLATSGLIGKSGRARVKRLPKMSNSYCHPGRAGGSPY